MEVKEDDVEYYSSQARSAIRTNSLTQASVYAELAKAAALRAIADAINAEKSRRGPGNC